MIERHRLRLATGMALLLAGLPAMPVSAAPERALLPVTMEMDPRLPDHTIYRPQNLARAKGKLPIVAFGNGGCINVGNAFQAFLSEVAANGYLVAAGGPIVADPGLRNPPPEQNRTEQLIATIDWALAENKRKGSPYFRRLDPSRVAVMGQSCGGLQAIAAGADPRVKTVLVLNSGIIRGGIPNPDGTTRARAYLPATEPDLARLHTPIAYLIGGPTDQAHRGAEGDFEAITTLPLFNANLDVGHGGTWRQPRGGEMARVAIAWLDWQLKGDRNAKALFAGDPCGLCADSRWTVKKRNLP